MERLIFSDWETAGPDPNRHPIIQIAAIAVNQELEVLEAFEATILFNPKYANAYSLRKNHYHPAFGPRKRESKKSLHGTSHSSFAATQRCLPCQEMATIIELLNLLPTIPPLMSHFFRLGMNGLACFYPPGGKSSAPCSSPSGTLRSQAKSLRRTFS